jgi:transcriptional regulator with XRE-family HTH domain
MNLGKNILTKCRQRGWSLAQLAKISSVPKSTIHGWITGQQSINLKQLANVSSALESPIYELAFGFKDPFLQNSISNQLEEIFTGKLKVSIQKITE